jgi:hypothetical protein
MTSLEIDPKVLDRQLMNMPASCVELTNDSTTDFTEDYTPGRIPLIAWFDYTKPDWKTQLSESCDLLEKLPPHSIFKLTLTGSIKCLGGAPDNLAAKAERFSEIFGDYGPFAAVDMSKKEFCKTLYRVVRGAIGDAVPDTSQRAVRSLASFTYDDGTPILTITMLVAPMEVIDEVVERAWLLTWPFADINWAGPKEISVPQLSLRERLLVDTLLPKAAARTVVNQLKLRLENSYANSVAAMKRYIEFKQHVPQFLRIAP